MNDPTIVSLAVKDDTVFRVVLQDDALLALRPDNTTKLIAALQEARNNLDSSRQCCVCVATSLPDYSEFASFMDLDAWKEWFIAAAALCMRRCCAETSDADSGGGVMDGCCIFYQTDICVGGVHVSKPFLLMQAAERVGMALRWHKIACRATLGSPAGGAVATYSHLVCFSQSEWFTQVADRSGNFPDVLAHTGDTSWARGTGATSSFMIATFVAGCLARIRSSSSSDGKGVYGFLYDPFCGHGSLLAAANAVGLDCIGVELGAKRARKATKIRLVPGSRKTAATFQFEGDRMRLENEAVAAAAAAAASPTRIPLLDPPMLEEA
jgi:hypothetical protein